MILRVVFILFFAFSGLTKTQTVRQGRLNSNTAEKSTKAVILEQAQEKLKAHFSSGKYRFKVQPRWIPNHLLKQNPDHILGLQLKGEVRRYTNFEVRYRWRGSAKRAEIQLKVEIQQKLPVASTRLEQETKLTAESLNYQWVSLSRNRGEYIIRKEQLIGKTLRSTLLSGQPVRKSDVSRKLIIQAGDEISVIIKRSGIQIQVAAEARQQGARGDRIKAYSKKTRKNYVGEVLRPGVILWKSTL